MPYVKTHAGMAPTGKMLTHSFEDEDGTPQEYQYQEQVDTFTESWHTPWQPEHAPVGSVVLWKAPNGELKKSTVAGHVWNGVRSWCIVTDEMSERMASTVSFNGEHLVEIVSRGKGGMNWYHEERWAAQNVAEYNYLRGSLLHPKRKSHYVSRRPSQILGFVLSNHPAFANDGSLIHILPYPEMIMKHVGHLFTIISDGSTAPPECSVSKKKLVTALKRVMPRLHRSKDTLEKEEAEYYDNLD